MMLILAIAALLNNTSWTELLENISLLSKEFHKACLDGLPASSTFPQAHAALLCGQNVTEENLKSSLLQTSLIHLFVVSGSHLLLLQKILAFFKTPSWLQLLLGAGYSLACGWQPPIVRAGMQLFLAGALRIHGTFISSLTLTFWSGISVLIFFPQWLTSRSLQMSWIASICLSYASHPFKRHWAIRISLPILSIYLGMMPALWGFGNLHPLSMLFNIFWAPFVTFVFFPLSAACALWPPLSSVFDFLFSRFLAASEHLSEPVTWATGPTFSVKSLWIYIGLLHFIFHFSSVIWRRKKY